MQGKKLLSLLVLAGVIGGGITLVWADLTTQDVRKMVTTLRPYQVLSGQVATTDYEVLYVLDNDSRRLAVLKYDQVKRQLIPIAGRNLTKDFGSEEPGLYSMVTTQLTGQTGLLYVTDCGAHRAIVYRIDLTNNTVTPQQPLDLTKIFSD